VFCRRDWRECDVAQVPPRGRQGRDARLAGGASWAEGLEATRQLCQRRMTDSEIGCFMGSPVRRDSRSVCRARLWRAHLPRFVSSREQVGMKLLTEFGLRSHAWPGD
jgi:hypothetical protein